MVLAFGSTLRSILLKVCKPVGLRACGALLPLMSFYRSLTVMSHSELIRRLILALSLLLLASTPLLAQNRRTSEDPMSNPRNVKPELKKAYKDWLEKDV